LGHYSLRVEVSGGRQLIITLSALSLLCAPCLVGLDLFGGGGEPLEGSGIESEFGTASRLSQDELVSEHGVGLLVTEIRLLWLVRPHNFEFKL
jgi:hypothetical protein